MAALLAAVGVGAQEVDTAAHWMPQTAEYERFLRGGGRLRETEADKLVHPLHYLGEYLPGAEFRPAGDTLRVRLLFVDATRGRKLRRRLIDDALFDLNGIYGTLPENGYGLRAISFCAAKHVAPQPFRYRRGQAERRRERDPDASAFDYRQWRSYLREQREWLRGRSRRSLPIIVANGSDDLLGFALGTSARPAGTDAVAISLRLLRKDVRQRETGKMLAHLIANHLGLRPLWHPAADGGDLIGDTPQHNAPNHGSYPPGEHASFVEGFPLELTDNVMDNTADRDGVSWTPGQVEFLAAQLLAPEMRGLYTENPGICPVEGAIEEVQRLVLPPEALRETGTVQIAPNPAGSSLSLAVAGLPANAGRQTLTIRAYDQGGRLVAEIGSRDLGPGQPASLDVSHLDPGTYWLRLDPAQPAEGGAPHATRFVKL